MTVDGERSVERRAALADQLQDVGDIRSDAWRTAFLAVPREVFVPRFYEQGTNADGFSAYRPITPDTVGVDRWLDLVYENTTWVTQLDHGDASWGRSGPQLGTPTSSSTKPGVVVRMLEDLSVDRGMRVLEVGTGTGYSTALLCARLGDGRVTTIEHDAVLSERAGQRLAGLGHRPTLVVGDGADGHRGGAPYDRVVATYSPAHVPAAWIEQVVPGGEILVSVAGGLDTYGYVRLTVGDGMAEGRIIDGDVSFMPSRAERGPELGPLMRVAREHRLSTDGRASRFEPTLLDDRALRWVCQLFVPGARTLRDWDEKGAQQWFLDPDGSWAVVEGARVYEGGPRPMWARLEAAVDWWERHGRPAIDRFHLRVTADACTYRVDGAEIEWARQL